MRHMFSPLFIVFTTRKAAKTYGTPCKLRYLYPNKRYDKKREKNSLHILLTNFEFSSNFFLAFFIVSLVWIEISELTVPHFLRLNLSNLLI